MPPPFIPPTPPQLKGFNLLIAFITSLCFSLSIPFVVDQIPALKSVLPSIAPAIQLAVLAGLFLTLLVGWFILITKILASAAQVDLAKGAHPKNHSELQEGNAVGMIGASEEMEDPLLKHSYLAAREGADSASRQAAKVFFPQSVAYRYRVFVLLFAAAYVVVASIYTDKLNAWLFPAASLNIHATIVIVTVRMAIGLLIATLMLMRVQDKHNRYKVWRVSQSSFVEQRRQLSRELSHAITSLEFIVSRLRAWRTDGTIKAKRRRVLAERWHDDVEKDVFFHILPIKGQLIDFPESIERDYDVTRKHVEQALKNLCRSEVLALPKPRADLPSETTFDEVESDLSSLNEHLSLMRTHLSAYNLVVQPYLADAGGGEK